MGKQARMVGDRVKFLEQYTLPLNLEPTQELDLEPRKTSRASSSRGARSTTT